MSTQVNPFHNIDALNVGTVEFHFSNGAVSAADAKLKGYRYLGNVLEATPKLETKKVDHFGSYRGKRIKDKSVVTETLLDYSVKCDELTFDNLLITFSGTETTAWTQSAMTLTAADTFAFTATVPTVASVWYDLTISSAQVRKLTGVTLGKSPQVAVTATNATDVINETSHGRANGDAMVFTEGTMPTGLTAGQVYYIIGQTTNAYQLSLTVGGAAELFSTDGSGLKINSALIEGTNFEVDLELGRIRIITAQTGTVYPYVTGPAVTASADNNYFKRMIPLDNPTRTGYGKLIAYDQDDRNKIVFIHHGFSCEVMIDSVTALDGQKFVEQTFTVATTANKGFIDVRNVNLAAA